MSKRKYIITGSSGFIGQNFIKINKLNNYLGLDRKKNNMINGIKINLSNNKFAKIINYKDLDIVFHFAGYSNLDYQKNFDKCFSEDYKSLINLINFLKTNKSNSIKLVYASSSYVYQNLNKKIVNEGQILNPVNPFGIAKAFFENIIKHNYNNYLIFRVSSVFGSNHVTHPNMINQIYESAKKQSKIDVWGNGSRKLQFIGINELVRTIYKSKNLRGIYNIGLKNNLSTKRISQIIANSFKKKISINYLKNKSQAETLPIMSINKIVKNSSEIKKINLEEQIIKFCKNQNDN